MTRTHRPALVVGLIFLGSALALSLWPDAAADGAVAPSAREAHVVRVAPVESRLAGRSLRLPGVTRAERRATLSFTVPARLAEREVEVGDAVRSGQLLASVDDREHRHAEQAAAAALAELETRLGQARRDLDRTARLADARAATDEELEQVRSAAGALEAAHAAAAARLGETRRLLREARLVAPFAGTVTAVYLEPGEWAAPGHPVVELSGRGGLEVRVEAPETVRARIGEGSPVAADLPFLRASVPGRVSSVADAASGAGGLFPVTVRLAPAEGVVAGLAAEVVLFLDPEPHLSVPLAAVVDPGSSRPSVFRIRGGVAERVAIRPGYLIGDRLTVDAELADGELVAVAGHTALADRDRVEVR